MLCCAMLETASVSCHRARMVKSRVAFDLEDFAHCMGPPLAAHFHAIILPETRALQQERIRRTMPFRVLAPSSIW